MHLEPDEIQDIASALAPEVARILKGWLSEGERRGHRCVTKSTHARSVVVRTLGRSPAGTTLSAGGMKRPTFFLTRFVVSRVSAATTAGTNSPP